MATKCAAQSSIRAIASGQLNYSSKLFPIRQRNYNPDRIDDGAGEHATQISLAALRGFQVLLTLGDRLGLKKNRFYIRGPKAGHPRPTILCLCPLHSFRLPSFDFLRIFFLGRTNVIQCVMEVSSVVWSRILRIAGGIRLNECCPEEC